MRIVSLEEASRVLGVSVRSLVDRRYRARLGLPATKIGRKLGFTEEDIEKLVRKGRERLPVGSGERYG